MRISGVLNQKYPATSDMYKKVESTRVCMLYNELVQTDFEELQFSEAISLQQGSLAVIVGSHFEAHKLKLYEFDIIQALNKAINVINFEVKRLQIRMR
jgi:hypothetical protein